MLLLDTVRRKCREDRRAVHYTNIRSPPIQLTRGIVKNNYRNTVYRQHSADTSARVVFLCRYHVRSTRLYSLQS